MGIALFVVGNLAAILTGASLVDVLRVRGDWWLRVTAGVVCYGAAVVGALLITGGLGILRPWTPVLLLGVVTIICMALAASTRRRRLAAAAAIPRDDPPVGPMMRFFVALALGMALATIGRLCFGSTGFTLDDYAYHALAVAEWIQQGGLTPGSFTYQAYFPQNAELVSLWFALPLGSDALVSLGSAYWLLLLVVAATTLARQMGARGWLQAVPALGLLLSSQVMLQVASFTPTALAEAASLAAALALMVPLVQTGPSAGVGIVASGGLAGGLAIGARAAALPLVALLVVFALIRVMRVGRARDGVRVFAVLLAAIVATGGYWYARNAAMTGNPLYPVAIGSLEGPFDGEARAQTTLLYQIRETGLGMDSLMGVSWWLLNWPMSLGLLAVLGYGTGMATVVSLIRRRSRDVGPRTALVVLVLGLAAMVIGPLMPFSGVIDHPDASLSSGLSFWMAPFSLGLILMAAARREWEYWIAPPVIVLLALAVSFGIAGHAPMEWSSVIFAGIALGIVAALWWRGVRRRLWVAGSRGRTLVSLALAILIVFGAWAPTKQRLTDGEVFGQPGMGAGWRAVNELPSASRIAWFGPMAYAYYPLYGRDYQLYPVPVFDDGSPWVPLHQRTSVPASRWNVIHHQQQRWGEPEDISRLIENLQAQRIEYVFTTIHGSERWPPRGQEEILEASDIAAPVHRDGVNTIWRIREVDGGGQTGEGVR